jgi:PAS domain S-box-containing protein
MKTKPIMLFSCILFAVAFWLFIVFYQNHLHTKAMIQISDHAKVIASSLWTFEKPSPIAYLTLAAKANGYERIVVKDDLGRIFLGISGPMPTNMDRFLLSVKMIPVYHLKSVVRFEGKNIGTISAVWPCRTIYLYTYILFCIFLLLTGIWLLLKLLDSNRTLESRVQKRTAELEAENRERRRTEEALYKYERIVSTSSDLIAMLNRDYVYEAVNESVMKAHNRRREEIVGRRVAEVMGDPVFRETLKPRLDLALSGETVHFQEVLDLAGLGRRTMDITYFPMLNETTRAVEGVVFNGRDITETRKLEEQLIQSQKIESIGTLAGGVAHEINNPINGIMNYAQLILDRTEEGSAGREYAQEILLETKRVAKIVRNLLTFARNEKQTHSPAAIADIVAAVLSLIQTVIRHDQIILELDVPHDLPKIKCRSQQVQQVLMNLMTNARDALNERYPQYSPEKRLRVVSKLIFKEDRDYIRTTVEDFGIGIPEEIQERIFDPFFTTKPKESGTGLGLSISYGIVRDHRGDLILECGDELSTRFHVDLPVDNGWKLAGT